MKNAKILAPFLLATLFLTSSAIAQTVEKRVEGDLLTPVIAARCQYTPADADCVGASESDRALTNTNDDTTIAQLPHRMPGPPGRSPVGYPRAGYSGMGMPSPRGRHAAIGAAIGFGLGAAVGAKGSGGARVTLTFGVLGGLMGAAFGAMTPSFQARSLYRRGPWPEDEDQLASRSEPGKSGATQETSSPRTTPPDPAPQESAAYVDDRLPPPAKTR
jgi:hypothetical protein